MLASIAAIAMGVALAQPERGQEPLVSADPAFARCELGHGVVLDLQQRVDDRRVVEADRGRGGEEAEDGDDDARGGGIADAGRAAADGEAFIA